MEFIGGFFLPFLHWLFLPGSLLKVDMSALPYYPLSRRAQRAAACRWSACFPSSYLYSAVEWQKGTREQGRGSWDHHKSQQRSALDKAQDWGSSVLVQALSQTFHVAIAVTAVLKGRRRSVFTEPWNPRMKNHWVKAEHYSQAPLRCRQEK